MKKYIIILIAAAFASGLSSCNYLDIVPSEKPTEDDAFRDQYSTENYLYGCYAFMPKLYEYMQYVNTTELTWSKPIWGTGNITTGVQSATSLGQYTFWSRYYGAIKRCYQLIDSVDGVPLLQEAIKTQYKGEAKFLIAYYHFMLLRAYGPIPIIDHNYPADAADFPPRSDMDTCVQWISDMFDESFDMMPMTQPDDYYGRASGIVAKTMKAKLWLYAASPLFNGNSEFYSNTLIDPVTNQHLVPQTVDNSKWSKALEYALEAVRACEQNGIALYNTEKDPSDVITEPSDPVQYKLRMMIPDKMGTREIIWADTRAEGIYDMQNNGTPYYWRSPGWTWNMNSPTLETVKRFYTSRGLPIEEDPNFVTPSEYYSLGDYEGAQTAKLHIDREPRFYSWISFHNGWFEMVWQGDEWGEGTVANKRIRTKFRLSDPQGASQGKAGTTQRTQDFTNTGYLNKKFMHPLQNATASSINTFPYSIIRLGELYLMVAEAAIEANQLETGKEYLNKIRTRAGIPTVETSWAGVADLTQSKLRQIVRRERMIELYLECELMWDAKRWKTMHELIPPGNGNPHGLNIAGITDAAFFRETEVMLSWRFETPSHYLLPIPSKDVDIIPGMVQNPGY